MEQENDKKSEMVTRTNTEKRKNARVGYPENKKAKILVGGTRINNDERTGRNGTRSRTSKDQHKHIGLLPTYKVSNNFV